MSQVQGTVVSFSANTKVAKRGGGQYDAWELVYRDGENKISTIAKPVQGLRFNPSLAGQLNSLQPGDEFTATMEKNDQGFLDVKSVVKGFSDGTSIPSSGGYTPTHSTAPRSGATPKSTYETAEERAKKQVVIVRQGVLNAAIASLGGGRELDEKEVIARAKEFEKYVYANLGKVAKKYIEADNAAAAAPDNGEE